MQDEFDRRWNKLAQEVLSGMRDWRVQHATATFAEIEEELDQRMARIEQACWKIWRWPVLRPRWVAVSPRSGRVARPVEGSCKNEASRCAS